MRNRIKRILQETISSDIINPLEILVVVQNTKHQKLVTHQISNLVSLSDAKYLGINEQQSEGGFTIFARFINESTRDKFLRLLDRWMERKHPEIVYKCHIAGQSESVIL
jgi:hypothetical protein